MKKPKRNDIDLEILFQELDHALDFALATQNFTRAEKLCDELIEVVEEIYEMEEESPKMSLIYRQ
jgi:hypothetical protein